MPLMQGDYAPTFTARSSFHAHMRLEHLAGRVIALTFVVGSTKHLTHSLAENLRFAGHPFDDVNAMHFFVVIGESGEIEQGIKPSKPGHRVYFDKDSAIAALYEVDATTPKPLTFILSRHQQIVKLIDDMEFEEHADAVIKSVEAEKTKKNEALPLIKLEQLYEAPLLEALKDEAKRALASKPVLATQPQDKLTDDDLRRHIRIEALLKDEALTDKIYRRLMKRAMVEIKRSFAYTPVHVEEAFVIDLRGEDLARLDPFRFKAGKGKSHRRFVAITLLENDNLRGGGIHFPEFSQSPVKLNIGETLIFSTELLLEIKAVREGNLLLLIGFLGEKP